jgi:predicted secreted protein with PEFG-CTERM motif
MMQKFNLNKVTSGLIITFLLVTIVSFTGQVNAQAPPNMPGVITGQYSNADYGVQITFPDGWTGMEVTGSTGSTTVIASKMSQESSNAGSPGFSMILNMMPIPKTTTTTNPNIPNDPKVKCDTPSSDNTNVNGMSAIVMVLHCSSPDGEMKMKVYSFYTDKNVISVMFSAMPSSLYDSNVATFDSSVNTLQIANTVAPPSAPQSTPPATTQNPTSNAVVPEFPTVASLILVVSVFAVIGFTMISRKSGLSLFGRN